jgi:GNAT superfamily N-acetyltransferase
MKFIPFSAPEPFLACVKSFLEAHETANNLMLGVALRLQARPDWTEIPPYLGVIEDEQHAIQLACLHTPPNRMILTGNLDAELAVQDDAIAMLIQHVRAAGWAVPGITGEKNLARRFAEQWQQATGSMPVVKTRERVYELRQVIFPQNPAPGRLRPATKDDLETVARWYFNFSREATHEGDPETAYRSSAQRIDYGDVYLWDNGQPVSMAFRARPTPHGYSVSGVYTPPDQRGQGFASICVATLSQLLLDSGKQFCTLFTDLDYPTSNSVYQKIGYRPVCDYTEYLFK